MPDVEQEAPEDENPGQEGDARSFATGKNGIVNPNLSTSAAPIRLGNFIWVMTTIAQLKMPAMSATEMR